MMGGPVAAGEVLGWFRDHYRNGKLPAQADCESLAVYLNDVIDATGGHPSRTRPEAQPNPLPAAVTMVLAAIGESAGRTGAIPGNSAVSGKLARLAVDLRRFRHFIEIVPAASTRSDLGDITDTIGFLVMNALRAGGRQVTGIGSNAEAPILKVIQAALARAGHRESSASIASRLRRDTSPMKLVALASKKMPPELR